MSVHPKSASSMRQTLIEVLGGVLAGSLAHCTPASPATSSVSPMSSDTSAAPTASATTSPSATASAPPLPSATASSASGVDPCAKYTVTKSAKVRLNEAQVCDLLGPEPGYSIPIGPHTTQPGACERLCKDPAFSSCQIPGEAFMAYKNKNTTAKCPTGYLGGVELTCEVRVVNPGYRGQEKCPEPVGRPYAGFRASIADARTVADYLSNAAEVEAASVAGFLAVRDALARFGAPSALVRECEVAAEEENHHALLMSALAVRRGGAACATQQRALRETTMLDLALENASVGVVRETFGALLALHQAERAPDADVRDAMATIARDECAHAALSFAIDAWLDEELDASSRARVSVARREAVEGLARSIEDGSLGLPEALGMPSAVVARAMLAAVDAALWAA